MPKKIGDRNRFFSFKKAKNSIDSLMVYSSLLFISIFLLLSDFSLFYQFFSKVKPEWSYREGFGLLILFGVEIGSWAKKSSLYRKLSIFKANKIHHNSGAVPLCSSLSIFRSFSFLILPKNRFLIWFWVLPSIESSITFQFLPWWFKSSTNFISSSKVQHSLLMESLR